MRDTSLYSVLLANLLQSLPYLVICLKNDKRKQLGWGTETKYGIVNEKGM